MLSLDKKRLSLGGKDGKVPLFSSCLCGYCAVKMARHSFFHDWPFHERIKWMPVYHSSMIDWLSMGGKNGRVSPVPDSFVIILSLGWKFGNPLVVHALFKGLARLHNFILSFLSYGGENGKIPTFHDLAIICLEVKESNRWSCWHWVGNMTLLWLAMFILIEKDSKTPHYCDWSWSHFVKK